MDDDIVGYSPRLVLRYFRDEDKQIFYQYRNNEQIYKYQSWPIPFTGDHLESFFRGMKHRDLQTKHSWLQLAIVTRDRGELVGDCAFHNQGESAEIGITIRPQFQRQGYAKEALISLLNLLFDQLSVHRVIAILDVENIGSRHLMESLGFRKEGHHLRSFWDDRLQEWRDEYTFAILNSEFILQDDRK